MDNTLDQSLARLACSCRILELEGHGDMTRAPGQTNLFA